MVETADAFAPLTKEDKKERRRLKRNPNKGELRTYPLLDHLCNTWEGILVYSLPGIITTWILFSRSDFSSWGAWWQSTFANFSWVISFILLIPFTISAFKYWVIWFRSIKKQDDFDTTPRIVTKMGVPRQGKSSTMNYECVLTAKKCWTLLRVKYANYLCKLEKKKELSAKEKLDFAEIKASYNFCVQSKGVPLLYTNTPIKVGKRYSHKLVYDHLTGRKKLPLHSVLVIDEASRFMDAGKSMYQNDKKDWDLSNFFALEGHFGSYIIYLASQDDNIFLDACRCSLYTEIMNKQIPCCKPFWLTALKTFYFWFIAELNRKKPRPCRFLMAQYNFFDNLWKRVGYRKYIVSRRANRAGTNTFYNNVQDGKTIIGNSRNYAVYFPAKLNCEYDDRTFRELSPSYFNEEITGQSWERLRLGTEDSFLRQTKSEFEIELEKKRLNQMVKDTLEQGRNKKNGKKSVKKK